MRSINMNRYANCVNGYNNFIVAHVNTFGELINKLDSRYQLINLTTEYRVRKSCGDWVLEQKRILGDGSCDWNITEIL